MSATLSAPASSSMVAGRASNDVGEAFRVLERPVGDHRDRRPARAEVPRGQLAHPAGTDEHDASPASRSNTCSASAAAAAGIDAGLSPIAVSTRARRPARSAMRKVRPSSGPGDPASNASLHLAEDLALSGHHRVEPGRDPEQMERSRLVCEAIGSGRDRGRAGPGELEERSIGVLDDAVVTGDVELGAVAGREHDGFVRRAAGCGERARQLAGGLEVDRNALAHLEGRAMVRDTGEREPHAAKWVRGSTAMTRTSPASRSPCESAAADTRLPARGEGEGIDDPDEHGDGHRRVEPADIEPAETDDDPRREEEQARERRAGGEPVEGLERRQAEPQDGRVTPLEAALLEDVERRHGGGDREAGEPREHQGRMERERPPVPARAERGPAAHPGEDDERGCDGHHREPDEPIARRDSPRRGNPSRGATRAG